MFNIIPISYVNVATGLLFSLLIAALGFLLFYYMWAKNHDFRFPRGRVR